MKVKPEEIHLVFFLSRATPLTRWQQRGIYAREIALYKSLAEKLGKVSIVTSGGPEELAFQDSLGEIEILYNRGGLSPNLYSLLAPYLHRKSLSQATIFKTNQLDGAWTAILAGKLHRKPVIARAGYLWARNFQRTNPGLKSALIEKIEAFSVRRADALMVTTVAMEEFLSHKYAVGAKNIYVSPNYVDTDIFQPLEEIPKFPGRVCFVGRLSGEKNLPLLLEAVSGLHDISLQLIGEGQGRNELQRLAATYKPQVIFSGLIPHYDLPEHINQAEIFILPSKFEGHPKALIEAMSCGAAVIGTDVEGIQDVIQHRKTGLLCQPTAGSIRAAIQEMHTNPLLRQELGLNARRFVLENYALDQIVEPEIEIYQSVIAQYGR